MEKKAVFLIFAVILLFCGGKTAWAVEDPIAEKIRASLEASKIKQEAGATASGGLVVASKNASSGERETVANINIYNAEISEIKKNQLKLIFDAENSMELQSNLVYGLELIKELPDGRVILSDVRIFPKDKITIEKDKSIHRELVYQSPEYLNGDFILWLKIKDESGLVLALQSFNVNLAGSAEFIEQGNPCYLTIEGEKDQKYNLAQGVDLKKEEKLFLNCQTKNFTGEAVAVLPVIEFYQRDLYGKKTGEYKASQDESITFGKDEEKLIKIAIPLPENPQAYDAKIVFEKDGKIISNPAIAHFVLSGKSGAIINASLDKNQYTSGEKAQLTLLWTGSADTFRNSRTGGSFLVGPTFEVTFKTTDGTLCNSQSTYQIGEFKTILSIPLEKACVYPTVTIKLVDEGQVLYEKVITTEPEKETKEQTTATEQAKKNNLILLVVILFAGLVLALFSSIYLRRKKARGISKVLFFLLVFGASFLVAEQTRAWSDYLYGDAGWLSVSDSNLYGANWVPMYTCGLDPNILPQCPRNYRTTPYCKFNNNALWYGPWGGIYGCYKDIVGFYYGLSGYISNSKLINQGSQLTANGTATGVNVCNNGVTAGIVVDLRNNGDAQWVLGSTYFSDSSPHPGVYSVDTHGWSCTSYTAKFAYAFKHGYTSNVATSYDRIGLGAEGYEVVNCCSNQTCSTGPGCRASLTNGVVAAGTCCSGSCYNCAAGYYWTGSMCSAKQGCSAACTANEQCSSGACSQGTCSCTPTCSLAFTESKADPTVITSACLGDTKGLWTSLSDYNRTKYDLWGKCQKFNGGADWKLDENYFSAHSVTPNITIYTFLGEERCQAGIFPEGAIPNSNWSNKIGFCSTGTVNVTNCATPCPPCPVACSTTCSGVACGKDNCGKQCYGTKTDGACCAPINASCAASTCVGSTCNDGCNNIPGTKTDGACCVPNNAGCAANTCVGSTCNDGCNNILGTKTDGVCCISNGSCTCTSLTCTVSDCGKKIYPACIDNCNRSVTPNSCEITCPACNSGNWREVTPQRK